VTYQISTADSKSFNVHTQKKDLNEILLDLKKTFVGLELDMSEAKKGKSGNIKLKARKSQGRRKGRTSVKVEVTQSEDGVEVSFKQPKKGREKKEFNQVISTLGGALVHDTTKV